MRLKTIWTIPAMSTMERFRRTRDWSFWVLAAKLPLRLRYVTTLQEITRSTRDSPNIPATTLDVVLKNLDKPKSMS